MKLAEDKKENVINFAVKAELERFLCPPHWTFWKDLQSEWDMTF